MSTSQEKTGERHDTLPVKKNSPLNEPVRSIGHLAAQGFDSLGASAPRTCGQYQCGGAVPIVAPAARVSPAAGEV